MSSGATRAPWKPTGPLTDRVRITRCPQCGRPVLEALADGVLPTRVDTVMLTPRLELALLVAGGTTLRLYPDPPRPGIRPRLAFRDHADITRHPGRGLPRHDCTRDHGPPDPQLLPAHNRRPWPDNPNF